MILTPPYADEPPERHNGNKILKPAEGHLDQDRKKIGVVNESFQCLVYILVSLFAAHLPGQISNFPILLTFELIIKKISKYDLSQISLKKKKNTQEKPSLLLFPGH